MKSLAFTCYALACCAAAALLGGCGGSQPPIGAPGRMPQVSAFERSSTDYRVLYSFGGGSDGANPVSALIDVGGTLYGTTAAGGSYACPYQLDSIYSPSCGTVFSITRGGTENVLHVFGGYPNDGANPYAALIDVKGTLYGTTGYGGGYDCPYYSCGTLFSITT